MLIILAIALLLLLPSPWSFVGFFVVLGLWLVELWLWNRTVRHKRKAVGAQTLIGRDAVVSAACRPVGQVRLDGEIWAARCDGGASPGDRVKVIGRDRLMLLVEADA